MGSSVARIGDKISHGGTISSGSANVFCNGIGVARIGDPVACDLHGAQTITGGSTTVFANSKRLARVGDSISCGAVITTGSPDVFAG